MNLKKTALSSAIAVLLAGASLPALANELDALNLQAEPVPVASSTEKPLRMEVELAAITGTSQPGGATEQGHRVSVGLRLNYKLDRGLRLGISNRLDEMQPAAAGQRSTRNHLREAHLSWQPEGGNTSVDIGRLNVRHGPAYGYNPTDYLRAGATQSVVSADPIALRENRLGTFMVRGSRTWDGGGASLILAPKLTNDGPSSQSLTLNLGATNSQDRLMLTVNSKVSAGWSGELVGLLQAGSANRFGANFTGLLTDALVMHGEWSTTRSAGLLAQALAQPAQSRRIHQAALGLTWSAPTGTIITAEAAFNGAGLNQSEWQTVLAQGPATVGRFFGSTQADQELAARRSWLLYATHKGVGGVRQLDITGFIRQNAEDRSHLAWLELRYHWPRFDAAVQWQRSSSRVLTEYGSLPYRQVIQLLGAVYF